MAATLKLSKQGIDIIEQARRMKGWTASASVWSDMANTSAATLKRFRQGQPVQQDVFIAICKAVGVENWKEIVDFSPMQHTDSAIDFVSYDNSLWVGRESLFGELRDKLRGSCRILLLVGIKGIGKTALAEKLVEELRDNWIEHRENFENQKQTLDFATVAREWLTKWGENIQDNELEPEQLLRQVVKRLCENQYLLLMDSFENLLIGNEEDGWGNFTDECWEKFFFSLLSAESCQSRLIITSQDFTPNLQYYRYKNYWYDHILEGLNKDEEKELIKKNEEKLNVSLEPLHKDKLLQFSKIFQGHPLALQIIIEQILKFYNGNVANFYNDYDKEIKEVKNQLKAIDNDEQVVMNFHRSRIKYQNIILEFLKKIINRQKGNVLVDEDAQIPSPVLESQNTTFTTLNQEILPEDFMTIQELHGIYNRDVYILIDQSGSMLMQDGANSDISRWDSLKEAVMSDVTKLIKKKVCDDVSIFLFSRNEVKKDTFEKVKSVDRVNNIFIENYPDRSTFITPTLDYCINKWFEERDDSKTLGAFFIIYTDGQFDDTNKFENLVKKTCKKIENEQTLKIFIIGVGNEIKNQTNREYFEELNANAKNNKNSKGETCDIVGFAHIDEVDDIFQVLEDELKSNK